MNPDENKLNMGANAGAGPSSMDLTGGAGASGVSGLSMADSLASAEDNLTAAGMAAKDPASNMMGLDQISASDPTAAMARPEEPLVPAAPVPGSIGSAVSGAAANPAAAPDASNPFLANNANDAATPTNGSMAPVLPNVGGTTNEAPAQAPFNPFAATDMQQASTPVMQPAMNGGAKKSSSRLMMIILAGIAVIAIVAAVIFAILWQQAANAPAKVVNNGQSETNTPSGSTNTNTPGTNTGTTKTTTVVCSKDMTSEEEGIISGNEAIQLGFVDGMLDKVSTGATVAFVDEATAESALPMLQMAASMAAAMYDGDAGDGVVQNGNVLSYNIAMTVAGLEQGTQPIGDDGSSSVTIEAIRIENGEILNPSREELVPEFRELGYTCVEQ